MASVENRSDLTRVSLTRPAVFIGGALILLITVGVAVGVLARLVFLRMAEPAPVLQPSPTPTLPNPSVVTATQTPALDLGPAPTSLSSVATSTVEVQPTPEPTVLPPFFEGPLVYGYSYNGAELEYYRFGNGPLVRLIVGGIHGGYEWNTVELVYDMIAHLQEYPDLVPAHVTLYVIPNMNPDGYAAGTDPIVARMNGNGVDLNRNWDYQWQSVATHGTRPVKAGEAPFSEPETRATRDFMLSRNVEAVIFYHSAMGVVFSGANRERSLTYELTSLLSEATGYPHQEVGIPGQVTTGDAIDWASTVGIAGTEIELTTHASVSAEEWQRNLRGLEAFLTWVPERSRGAFLSAPDRQAAAAISHVVQDGEVLSRIAERYGVSLEMLMYLNDITDPDMIHVGQVLLIPALATPEATHVP